MSPRRELWLAVLLCLLGSALVLVAVSQTWVERSVTGGLTIKDRTFGADGSVTFGWLRPLGSVGIAGVLAIAATKRNGRVLVGLLLALVGAGIFFRLATFLPDFAREVRSCPHNADCPPSAFVASHPVWGWVTLVGGALLLVGGLLVAARGRRWAALSSSYENPSARAEAAPVTDKGVWDALDEGHDPTA